MIPDETVSRVRERADIVEVIGEFVQLRRAGSSYKGLCPFHQEKTPSFNVSPSRQMYHCFGCGEGGDVFAFLMRYEGRTFVDAVRELGRKVGVDVEDRPAAPGAAAARQRRQAETERLLSVMEKAAAFYAKQLRGREAASVRDYLRGRGVPDEAVSRFGIGYAPAGWDALSSALKSMGVSPVEAERLGLVVARKGGGGFYDRLRDRVVFPVKDAAGRVVALAGRVLPGAAEDAPKYVNSPESPVFTKGRVLYALDVARDGMRRGEPAIVVEGYLDVISLHVNGFTTAVAPMGTALTAEQAGLLRRFGARDGAVVLLFDGDAAGLAAATRAQPAVAEAGLSARVALLPPGEDPDTFVRSRGPEAVSELLGTAVGLVEHLIDSSAQAAGPDGRSKAKAIRALWPAIAAVADPMERDLYKRRVSAAFGVPEEVVFRYLRGEEGAAPTDANAAEKPASARERAEGTLVGVLLDVPSLAREAVDRGALDLLSDRGLKWIVERLASLPAETGRTALLDALAEPEDEALGRKIRARLVKPRIQDPEAARRAVVESLGRLEALRAREAGKRLQNEVNQAVLEGDSARATSLAQEKLLRKRAAEKGLGGTSAE